ncbi:hypothetical protein Scep_017001 [Stephania cephalantha]|uniref:Secreted protein n=1 Tax=Stephania cephalantha TaxID=152367 RepID=A0AAP0IQ29_9MAGN
MPNTHSHSLLSLGSLSLVSLALAPLARLALDRSRLLSQLCRPHLHRLIDCLSQGRRPRLGRLENPDLHVESSPQNPNISIL